MKILAIDPATLCGWALAGPGGIVASGTWDLSTRRDESSGMKLVRLRAKLRDVCEVETVRMVVFERSTGHGPGAMAVVSHAELQGAIKSFCLEDGRIQFRGYSPGEIKKHATGKGNSNKEAMVAAAKSKWPGFGGDDNEADARWLADLAVTEMATGTQEAATA